MEKMSAKFSTLVVFMVLAMSHCSLGENLAADMVFVHNKARAEVGVPIPPVKWNDTLASFAYHYASTRLADCTLVHSNNIYGENLAKGWRNFSAVDAFNMWIGEKGSYHYDSNSCDNGKVCGHYTQVIWKASVDIGCARLKCMHNDYWFVSCNYYPHGNVIGQKPY